ncbi:MAG: O-antigen ligase family protein [Verrucomicrobiales bacterium]
MSLLRLLPLACFLLGYAILAVIGTRTNMAFQWPSYMLLGFAAVFTVFSIRHQLRAAPGTWCLVSMLMLTGYVVARALTSPVSYFARVEITMVLAAALTYILFSVFLVRSRYRLAFVGLLVILCIGNLLVGLYQVLRDPSFMVMPGYERIRLDGAGGFFDNHNHLGGFLLTVTSFVTALALFGKMGVNWRIVVGFLVPLSMVGIAITASRGALISLGFLLLVLVGISLYLARRFYKNEFKKIATMVVILLGIGLVPASFVAWKALGKRDSVKTGVGEGVDGLTMGKDVRFTNWSLAYDQWRAHPLVGQGSRMYDVYSVQHWPGSMNWVHGDPEFAHNDYLQMLGEYGAVGFALMLFFIGTHLVSGLRYLAWYRSDGVAERHGRTHNGLALCLGALAVLAGYSIHSLLDFNLHLPANLIPVAFAFAILATPSARSTRRRNAPAWLVYSTRLALPVCGAYLIVAGFFYSRAEWHLEKARRVEISNYSDRIAQLDQSLKYDDENFESHQLRGVSLMSFGFDLDIDAVSTGFMERASRSFERALEINPYDIFSLVGLARCQSELGEWDRAEELFVRATTLGPWRREPHLRFGYYYLDRGMETIREDLVASIKFFESGKAEILRSRESNERMQFNPHQDPDLIAARRYLSVAYEEHGHRLKDAADQLKANGEQADELAYLESAAENFQRAVLEASDRALAGSKLKTALDITEARLKEIKGKEKGSDPE